MNADTFHLSTSGLGHRGEFQAIMVTLSSMQPNLSMYSDQQSLDDPLPFFQDGHAEVTYDTPIGLNSIYEPVEVKSSYDIYGNELRIFPDRILEELYGGINIEAEENKTAEMMMMINKENTNTSRSIKYTNNKNLRAISSVEKPNGIVRSPLLNITPPTTKIKAAHQRECSIQKKKYQHNNRVSLDRCFR